MNPAKQNIKRIDINYALLQGVFWLANASLGAFSVAYLTYRGLDNIQIGQSTSLNCLIAILVQIVVANYLDKNMHIPIKNVICAFFVLGIALGIVLLKAPLGNVGIIIVFALCVSILSLCNGFISAQMMQFKNVGIDANFGWPRGVGSLCYALGSYAFGALAGKYTEGTIPVFYVISLVFCAIFVMTMPNPYRLADPVEYAKTHHMDVEVTSYKEMILGNPLLMWTLICMMIYSIGQSAILTYTVRAVERIGYGTTEYGLFEGLRALVEVPMLVASVWILKKVPMKHALVISLVASGARGVMIACASSLGVLYSAAALNVICSGIYVFAGVMFVNAIVRPTEKVRAQSLASLFYSIGSVIGNYISGLMLEGIGLTGTMLINAIICFLSGAFMYIVGKVEKSSKINS